jgi:hypothetical protein
MQAAPFSVKACSSPLPRARICREAPQGAPHTGSPSWSLGSRVLASECFEASSSTEVLVYGAWGGARPSAELRLLPPRSGRRRFQGFKAGALLSNSPRKAMELHELLLLQPAQLSPHPLEDALPLLEARHDATGLICPNSCVFPPIHSHMSFISTSFYYSISVHMNVFAFS